MESLGCSCWPEFGDMIYDGLKMHWVKKDAAPELVETVRQIEEHADQCFGSLGLLQLHWNVAVWAMLVGGVQLVEQEIANRGDNTPHLDAALLNLSRFISDFRKFISVSARDIRVLTGR